MNLTFYGQSIKNKREENMDTLFMKKVNTESGEALIVAVCDGVGSLKLGGYASSKTVLLLKEWIIVNKKDIQKRIS